MAKTNSTSLFSYSGLHSPAMKALILVLILALMGCGGIVAPKPVNLFVPTPTPAPSATPTPTPAPAVRSGVGFIGDSTTGRWDLNLYFPGMNYVNAGIGGNTTSQILARLPSLLSGKQACTSPDGNSPVCQSITPPATVMIFAGWNNVLGTLDPVATANDIQQMILLCKQAGVTPIVSTIYLYDSAVSVAPPSFWPVYDANLNAVNASIRSFAATQNVSIIDLEALFQGQSGYTLEGVHPNTNGYSQMRDAYNLAIPSVITQSQIFSNTPQTWTFESQCQNLQADGSRGPMVTAHSFIEIQPVDANHTVWHYTKDQPCAYWLPDTEQAELWFDLELDASGNWYSTGGIINAPFGNAGNGDLPVLDVTYPVNAKTGQARPYLILPSSTGFSYQTLFDDQYPVGGTALKTAFNALWKTSSYTEFVSTPLFTGYAYVSDQTESSINEKWYFAPNIGLVKVACPNEGAGTPCPDMIRTN